MKILRLAVLAFMVVGLVASGAYASKHLPEERGKALFNSPKLGGGTSGKSCNDCHPNGRGLEGAGNKKQWKTPGGVHKSLEETVNICITMALKGKALKKDSKEMKDVIAYIKSLKGKSEAPKKKKRKAVIGC